MKESKVVRCPYEKGDKRIDCFGRRTYDGKISENCNILRDTDFKEHDCPFYKSKEDYDMGLKIYGGFKTYS